MIVEGHGCHTALHFGVKAKENQHKVPTLYWLPKLHKIPYKARFIANSSYCKSTELSKLLTSCLTAVKNMLSKIVSEYDQEIPQPQTADNPVASRGRAAQPSRDTRKTN